MANNWNRIPLMSWMNFNVFSKSNRVSITRRIFVSTIKKDSFVKWLVRIETNVSANRKDVSIRLWTKGAQSYFKGKNLLSSFFLVVVLKRVRTGPWSRNRFHKNPRNIFLYVNLLFFSQLCIWISNPFHFKLDEFR